MDEPRQESEFARRSTERAPGILREFGAFLVSSKKWWLLPILGALLLLGLILVFGGTAVAPWIYTLF